MIVLVIFIYVIVIIGDLYLLRKEIKLGEMIVYMVMAGFSFVISAMLSLGKEIPAYVNYIIDAVNHFIK